MGQGKRVGVNLKPGGALVGKLSRGMAQCNPTQGALATMGSGWPDPWVGDRECGHRGKAESSQRGPAAPSGRPRGLTRCGSMCRTKTIRQRFRGESDRPW